MIAFILADLRRFWSGAVAIILLLALSVALSSVVSLQERALRLGTARASDRFDVVIGAAGSDTQLTLSSVFLQPSPLPLASGALLARLAADPRVAFAAPIGFGDSASGFPIVGTTTALISLMSPQLAEGRAFARLDEAVIGSAVNFKLGGRIVPLHGKLESGGHDHGEVSYHVTGRMAATGTAWDRAILVPIRAVWQIHGMAEAGVGADAHHHADQGLNEEFGEDSPGVPAIFVKPRTIADAYRLRQAYRSETSQAIFPAEVLTRLYATLGDARNLLMFIALGTQAIVALALLLVAVMHISTRKRQIGALRALGAPILSIMLLVWGELFLLLLIGIALGFALGFLAAILISQWLTATTAVHMPIEYAASDGVVAATFIVLAAFVSLVPALLTLRISPANALRA